MHVLDICDDLGTCWHKLGIKLKLPPAILQNIDVDYKLCCEKAREMLYKWMKTKGRSATVECLVKALEAIGNKKTAEKLLGTYVIPFLSPPPNRSHDLTSKQSITAILTSRFFTFARTFRDPRKKNRLEKTRRPTRCDRFTLQNRSNRFRVVHLLFLTADSLFIWKKLSLAALILPL